MLTSTQVTWTMDQKRAVLERARKRFGADVYLDDTDVVSDDRTVATVVTEVNSGDHVFVAR